MDTRGFAWLSLGIAAGALGLLGGCNVVDPFADYRDPGVNFIAGHPLATVPYPPGTTTDLGGTGYWDFAWREAAATYPYMTFMTSGEPGPSPSDTVWKLDLENLANNPDFEGTATASTPTGWYRELTAPSNSVLVETPAIHNKSARVIVERDSWAGFAFDTTMLKDYAPAATQSYRFNFNASGPSGVYYGLYDGGVYLASSNQGPLANPSGDNIITTGWGPTTGTGYRFVFGSSISSLNFLIDDLRALRSDIDPGNYALRIKLKKSDASPALSAGFYSFTLFIKKPAGTFFATEANAAAPYAANYVTIWIRQLGAQGTVLATPIKMTFPVTATWQQVTANGINFDIFHADPTAAVMEIRIAPFDYIHNAPDAGSVLIARPELHFHLNGY